MGWIVWIIIGIIAGWIAERVTNSDMGIFMNLIVGLIGSVIGGWIVNGLGFDYAADRFWPSLIVAALGAILLLFIVNMVFRRRRTV